MDIADVLHKLVDGYQGGGLDKTAAHAAIDDEWMALEGLTVDPTSAVEAAPEPPADSSSTEPSPSAPPAEFTPPDSTETV
jgi:hypothetical protein